MTWRAISARPYATAPTKYAILSDVDPAYLTTGVAKVKFSLACMRAA